MTIDLDMWLILKKAETHEEKYKEEIAREKEIEDKEDQGPELQEHVDSIKNNPAATSEEIQDLLDLHNTFHLLNIIGEGFFRIVYDLGDRVLKVAKFMPELNKYEANNDMAQDFPDLIPKVFQRAPDYSWIVQEKIEQLTDGELAEMFHLDNDEEFKQTIKHLVEGNINGRSIKGFPKTMTRMALLCAKYNIKPTELRTENIGYVMRDGKKQLVIFDASIFD